MPNTFLWFVFWMPLVIIGLFFVITTVIIYFKCKRLPMICKLPLVKHKWVIMTKSGHMYKEIPGWVYGDVLLKYCSRCLEIHNGPH